MKSIFVESVRLLIVIVLLSTGYALGIRYGAAFFGSALGASIGYVAGGVFGRFLRSATERVEVHTAHVSAAEFLAGSIGALLIGMLAALLSAPAIAILPNRWGWPVFGLVVLIGVNAGFRILRRKSEGLLALAHLSDQSSTDASAARARDAVLVDTSVLVDNRLLRLTRTGFLHRNLLVPQFILDEVRSLADSQELTTRKKSRWALESLEAIRRDTLLNVHVIDDQIPEIEDIDAKLIALASRLDLPLLTNDETLSRIAELRGVRCMSLHRLARSLSSVLAPGELLRVSIVKAGQEPGEGVGFLDEGSMVVVSDASGRVGQEVEIRVTSSARTPRGRIFFAELAESATPLAGPRSRDGEAADDGMDPSRQRSRDRPGGTVLAGLWTVGSGEPDDSQKGRRP